ncbi:D-alanyl-D-alanine carboxypeptidase/D-alanyl-D-alanine-endopeptidase [Specibacter cremeus]|uniref:D-alanyl-D-alanine carboxypeptidase/D-alanyl-D-alanine endopeptidase n=1 Tax=Specibacter cremeus TaxID=1629051 RepID=UPI0013DE2A28|nr:D-alanyl-D-alanine carboxypeptidase/D-alanyl-D-alanine-endopeptidase [Specibacter cremeus]
MGRISKAATAALLAVALAALAVPVGFNLAPALFAPAATTQLLPAAQLAPTAPATLSGVSALSDAAPLPEPAALGTALDAVFASDVVGDFTAEVTDAATGTALYSRNAATAAAPASNLKLLTSLAALSTLGAQRRFSTDVVAGSTPHSIVLRAGGDSLLGTGESDPRAVVGHAGLKTLADKTAAALKKANIGAVTLATDTSLFTGPALNPSWDSADVLNGEIAAVYPMALYGARTGPQAPTSDRPANAAASVAAAFATALQGAGIEVTGTVSEAPAGSGAVLASVTSATVAQQVQYLLQVSDNYVAEVMGRMAAVASGRPGSSAAAAETVQATVAGLGLDTAGMVLDDSCGLAAADRASARQLAAAVRLMATSTGRDADLRQALPGLPIAGLTGTLGGRFTDPVTLPGAGLVRAKTGTLLTVATLTGYVVDGHGRLLVFSFMANGLRDGNKSALPVLDAAAAKLAAD